MNHTIRIAALAAWLLVCGATLQCRAATYRTDRLAAIAAKLGLRSDADGSQPPAFRGRPVKVIADADGRISHIGWALFSDAQRDAFGPTVCNFVERYLLELDLPLNADISAEERMRVDGVNILRQTDCQLSALNADSTVGIHLQVIDARGYTMTWQRDGQVLYGVSFPVEYNLLVGTDMDERERRLPDELRRTATTALPPADSLPADRRLRKAWNDNYYTLEGGHYLTESLSANCYYAKDAEGHLQPIFQKNLPVESLANLLLTGAVAGDFSLSIRLRKYGFQNETVVTTPAQWLAFCWAEGCQPYFGIVSLTDDTADCELIMHCPDKGYNHVMRLQVPLSIVAERKGTITARLNAYVTASRIKNLFEENKQ